MDSQNSESVKWFAEEIQPHEEALRSVLRRSLPSADVDDLVQESFLRVWRARSGRSIRSGKNFLFAVARNALRDFFRRRGSTPMMPVTENAPLDVLESKPGVVELVIREQELALLTEAVQALPDRCREVFLLRKIQGLSQKEIAARLGITENTVESLVAKGARRCADFLRTHGLENVSRR